MSTFGDALSDLTAKGIEATLDAGPPATIPDGQDVVVACLVAPAGMDEIIDALPPDRLLAVLWWVEEVIRRANALKKGLLIEAVMAVQRGETSPLLEAGGHHYELREDHRSDWEDIPGLLYGLNRMGASVTDLASAVSGLRVTDLERVCVSLDEDVRTDAYETVKAHRVYKPTSPALVDLDSPYRRKK